MFTARERDMEILFVRHGETEANLTNLYYGRLDYSLTKLGKEQAKKAGNLVRMMNFNPDRIIVSGLIRTHETLGHMGYDIEEAEREPRINERDLGILEGYTYPQIIEMYPNLFQDWRDNWMDFTPEEGESQRIFSGRIKEFLEELKTYEGELGKVLVVTHGGTMKTIISIILGDVAFSFNLLEIYNCSILRVRLKEGVYLIDALYNVVDFDI